MSDARFRTNLGVEDAVLVWREGRDAGAIREQFEQLVSLRIHTPSLVKLAAALSPTKPPANTLPLLKWMNDVADAHWDFRRGAERADTSPASAPVDYRIQARAVAAAWGMTQTQVPTCRNYDHILILGGLARGCITRSRMVASLVEQGLTAKSIVGLTGHRHLSTAERSAIASMYEAKTERDAMSVALGEAFALKANYRFSTTDAKRVPPLINLTAEAGPGRRRANTADTLQTWLDSLSSPVAQSRILVVTSSIYVPYQGIEAIRTLGMQNRANVEIIGVGPRDFSTDLPTVHYRWDSYLQEIKAGINSMYHTACAELDVE